MKKKNYSITKEHIILNTPEGKKSYKKNTQIGCTLEVLIQNINKELSTAEITSCASTLYNARTSKVYAELTGRHVRSLREEGLIVTTKKGIFKFTGNYIDSKKNPFSKKVIDKILKRDNYTCQECGATKESGANLTADHIKPQFRDGDATLENGMCLCTTCQNRKNKLNTIDFGKKRIQKQLSIAKKEGLKEEIDFLKDLLVVYKKHGF